jgi:two-component system, OmpR family, response regulator
MRILIVDDDEPTRALLARSMGRAGHTTALAATCEQGEALASDGPFDLVLLDVMLPDGSGVELCRQLRASRVSTPILLLTARGAVGDRVAGLDAGADDYLSKPFAVSELLARVRALGRRGPVLREETIRIRDLEVDLPGRRILLEGKVLTMTARELAIVEVLVKHRGRVMSREDLMEAVWGNVSRSVAGSLEVLIARVRRKLGHSAGLLKTVRGVGYAFEEG